MTDSASSAPTLNLADQFLIAMPALGDSNFAGTVIYVCEHTAQGALGLVINRPTDLSMGALFERIDLQLEIAPIKDKPVFYGGPVQTDRGFVLHTPVAEFGSSLRVGQLALTTSRDVLQAVAAGQGPEHLLVTLGYAGWAAGQLEAELAENAWLTVSADPKIIFDTPPGARYPAALGLLGIDPIMLADVAGHA